ncbi:alkaline phosphatase PafA [Ascidiimonas sp. W6]|uniref:alkaline phosphatase PafA n=1 Tax=Ascidiimonas meishanensis TaxID=3128903 RepID=UPI0030ECEC42
MLKKIKYSFLQIVISLVIILAGFQSITGQKLEPVNAGKGVISLISKVQKEASQIDSKPKLVVGIVVDQMRYDYLTRFWNHYGNGGFKRLVAEGFNCRNNHFNYIPTYTGPGHASVYTGTTPAYHGIIGNDWFDKTTNEMVYCAGDNNYNSVGCNSGAGKMAPSRLMTSTITDQLRLATQQRGKVIGIALKDRGAILPAGHAANAAYWFEGYDEGKWITSDYYLKELPEWVKTFNKSGKAKSYLKTWNTLLPIESYVESGSDNSDFEGAFMGEKAPVFPHNLKKLSKENDGFSILKSSPFGNSLTLDFALTALEAEEMGKDSITDFLAISFSSTDYVGHQFGVNSKEVQDTYIRLDLELERLLKTLDEKVGVGEYSVFLTADHGGVNVPAYLESLKIPAGYVDTREYAKVISNNLEKTYNVKDLVLKVYNDQIFIDHAKIEVEKLNLDQVIKSIVATVEKFKGVIGVYTKEQMITESYTQPLLSKLQRGYNYQRSGDVIYVLHPATISYSRTGSTHGSGFSYDTHVPLLFYGKGINTGSTVKRTEITDIAPTIAALLGISFPNASIGNPIEEILD